jgi:transcription elongation factor Elf1
MVENIEAPKAELVQTSAPAPTPRKAPCPFCGSRTSRVLRTEGASRTRWCDGCGRRFMTHETPVS